MYNEVVVVEGKNDKARILAVFPNLEVITTNGSEISEETLDLIYELSKSNKIILFLDPDYPGERIRNIILNRVPNCYNVFIKKSKAIDERKHKVGVEHASLADIKEALEHCITFSGNKGNLTIGDLYSLGLLGTMESSKKRKYLCSRLNIGSPNGKTLLKRLNFMNLEYSDLEVILNEENRDSE